MKFHSRKHPRELGATANREVLTHVAQSRRVAISTQNQALAALQFLYATVLEQPLDPLKGVAAARRPHHLPNVLSREDAQRVLTEMRGTPRLMAMLLYGAGLRVSECCQLRIKDIDLERGELRVRRGKGDRDRVTMVPLQIRDEVAAQISRIRGYRKRRTTNASHSSDGATARGNGSGRKGEPVAARKLSYISTFFCDASTCRRL